MSYTRKYFDPRKDYRAPDATAYQGDRRDGRVYRFDAATILAVNVAMSTGRPLLVEGGSGNGKSSLAQVVARFKKWRYYEAVITSRSEARDLLWQVDAVERLADAQLGDDASDRRVKEIRNYVRPGVLWWAFQPPSKEDYPLASSFTPLSDEWGAGPDKPAVVLIDEIDKADPDFPNALLVPIGSRRFAVDWQEAPIENQSSPPPLLVITSNGERSLPPAFRRRCVFLKLNNPDVDELAQRARLHFGEERMEIIEALGNLVNDAQPPSTAEFLDAVKACLDLEIREGALTELKTLLYGA